MTISNSESSSASPVRNPVASVASRVADVTGDFLELAELQAALTAGDFKDLLQAAKPAIVGTIAGLTLILPALTIILIAASEGVAEYFRLSRWIGQLIIGAVAIVLATFLISLSMRRMQSAMSNLNSSMHQLRENITWLKSVFRG